MINFSAIAKELLLGSYPQNELDVERLSAAGVNGVLSLQTEDDFEQWVVDWGAMQQLYQEAGIEVQRVPMIDFNKQDIELHLDKAVKALDVMIKNGQRVYVHCTAGKQRAPTVVTAYLAWCHDWPLDKAQHHVTRRRACEPYIDVIESASLLRVG